MTHQSPMTYEGIRAADAAALHAYTAARSSEPAAQGSAPAVDLSCVKKPCLVPIPPSCFDGPVPEPRSPRMADMESPVPPVVPSPATPPDGFERLPGGGVRVTVDGAAWTLRPLDPRADREAAERHYASLLKSPLEAIIPELELLKNYPLLQDKLLDRAYAEMRLPDGARKPSAAELKAWLDSEDGMYYLLWRSMIKDHPSVTVEQCREVLISAAIASVEQLEKLLEAVNPALVQVSELMRAAGLEPGKLKPADVPKIVAALRAAGLKAEDVLA